MPAAAVAQVISKWGSWCAVVSSGGLSPIWDHRGAHCSAQSRSPCSLAAAAPVIQDGMAALLVLGKHVLGALLSRHCCAASALAFAQGCLTRS